MFLCNKTNVWDGIPFWYYKVKWITVKSRYYATRRDQTNVKSIDFTSNKTTVFSANNN